MALSEATSRDGVDAADLRTVAITGIGGLIGRQLAGRLLANDRVRRVVGIDLAPPSDLPMDPRLDLREADVRDPGLAEHFEGCDVVVHLAFFFDPSRDEVAMRSVNVDGTRNVFDSARRAQVARVVYTSSFVVYGGHPDNDLPLTEDSPLRANPDFSYAEHKYDIERWLWPWADEQETPAVTVIRPAMVVGRGVDNFLTRQAEMPRFISVKGYRPPWQFVHVDDVAAAIEFVIDHDLDGVYNVAAEGWLSHDETMDIVGKPPLELPEAVAFETVERMWNLGLGEAPPGELHYLMHPTVVSVDRLVAAGWQPRHSNREALAELVDEHRAYVNLLAVRAHKRTVRLVLAGALATLVALLLGRWLRRADGTAA